jgi:hypothetical protein
MENERTSGYQGFGRSWIRANALGFGVGMALFAAIAEGMERSGLFGSPEVGDIVGHLIGLILAGALFGMVQWMALRRHVAVTGWAVLGTTVGLYIGYVSGYELGGFPFDYILGPALAGLLGGAVQWLTMRRHISGAGWWVLASALGFLLGGIAGVALAFLGLGEAIGGSYFGWIVLNGLISAIVGVIGGAITWSALARLLWRSAPDAAVARHAASPR